MQATVQRSEVPRRLLDAAVSLIRSSGLHATTVDAVCAAAGVSKGAFFHHFESKEALAAAAADHWSETTGAMFADASYHDHADPADRVLAYVDLRARLIDGSPAEYSCLAGTMAQEAFLTSPMIRDACAASIFTHAATLEDDIEAALVAAGSPAGITAGGLARYTQVVLQGAFVVSKAAAEPEVAREALTHLHRYLADVLHPAQLHHRQ
jgi:TetR/AcrR family transcriptional regulator, transcriptional repressor for nem operon